MISKPQNSQLTHKQWLEKIHAALVRSRERAKVIAYQSGTPLIYSQNGQIVREYITEAPRQQSSTEG